MLIAKFIYNSTTNASIKDFVFKFNYGYYFYTLYKKILTFASSLNQ